MTISYTYTDEAPALATHSFLPIIKAFADASGVDVELKDISLAARILAVFPDHLSEEQRVPDALTELGELAKTPHGNIIKLPNISASIPQLKKAIAELQSKGFAVPDYPEEPETDEEREIQARYDTIKGSAVNPVLREGNSDRRAPHAVKEFVKKHPHSMGEWPEGSETHVATMSDGDFRSSERSITTDKATDVRIEHVAEDGTVTVLKESTPLEAGEVFDAAVMSKNKLVAFLEEQVADAKAKGVLFSVHLKATMMKVSDPIIFGHAVRAYFSDLFAAHGETLDRLGISANDGMASLEQALLELPAEDRAKIEEDIQRAYETGPALAQVDSHNGITNLHVPSDIIIDASMPAMIRASGQMWNKDDEQQDTKAVIPESSYAGLYDETIKFHQEHGAFDPTTMGTVQNVGLMAKKAEEYGSHDKTFEIAADGLVRVVDSEGRTLLQHDVEEGDIWRGCQTKDSAIRDWVKLAVTRARATGWPTIFWLDKDRAHDAALIKKIETYLPEHDTDGLDLRIMNVEDATRLSLERAKQGENTISVTGNVLRDYLTDLFPILELGTSAKMLSIVPLMNGGGLFETGAGGSAPKHVQQFQKENHLRWDSLGEFLALAASLDHYAEQTGNEGARVLGEALDVATERLLDNKKGPSRKVNEIDNRGSHFYLALYWAQAMAEQSDDPDLAAAFKPLADQLGEAEDEISNTLIEVQGQPMDIGGYYLPATDQADAAMRPSNRFNEIIDNFG